MNTKIFKELEVDGKKQLVIATSYSQIDTFLQCPHSWYQLYLLGLREHATSEALALGSAVHKTLEEYFMGLKIGKKFDARGARNLLLNNMDDYEIPYMNEENEVIAIEQHTKMMDGLVSGESQLALFLKDCEIIACEQEFMHRFELDFPIFFEGKEYHEVYLLGSIDMVARDQNGGIIVIDFKSSKKIFDNQKLKKNLQLPIYSAIIKEKYGELPVKTAYYFTRLDEIQLKPVIKQHTKDCNEVYYKTGQKAGQLKSRDLCLDYLNQELMEIFRLQYATGLSAYGPKPTPLCSWCDIGSYIRDLCENSYKFERKDIPIPEGREHYFSGDNLYEKEKERMNENKTNSEN